MSEIALVEGAAKDRIAAGHDPRKRQQILDGARELFLTQGFDAASMGDIARSSGVSKGTLYVYFDNKEELFAELCRIECEYHFSPIFALDPNNHDVEGVLRKLGREFVGFITQPQSVMGKRTVIAMSERMPELARGFYERGPLRCRTQLAEYFNAQVRAGVLAIDDTLLAAAQFLDMTHSTIGYPLLFGFGKRPTPDETGRIVDSAVRVFLAAYGAKAPAA